MKRKNQDLILKGIKIFFLIYVLVIILMGFIVWGERLFFKGVFFDQKTVAYISWVRYDRFIE